MATVYTILAVVWKLHLDHRLAWVFLETTVHSAILQGT